MRRSRLTNITRAFIEREELFTTKDRLLLAISGGIDSVCLAFVLRELGYNFDLIHFNFKLRGAASDGDQAFVERLSERLKVSLRLQSSNAEEVAAMSSQPLQETARNLRYDFFEHTATKEKYDYVITAHHLEDNLETTLMNLMRGTGVNGLTGIPAKRDIYRRPFLNASRNEIENYAAVNHILWREDASNASDNYRRNQLRHHVLPDLKSLDQNWSNQLSSTYHNLRRDQELINYSLTKTFEDALDNDGNIIRAKLPTDLQIAEQLLKHNLTKYGFSGDQFRQMITAKTGSEIVANSTGKLVKIQADLLVIRENKNHATEHFHSTSPNPLLKQYAGEGSAAKMFSSMKENTESPTSNPEASKEKALLISSVFATLKFPKNQTLTVVEVARPSELSTNDSNVIYLSKTTAPLPWQLRRPEIGDHFQPFGMKGQSKKLQDFFTDIKLPREERKNQWLLCDADGQILWVLGLRVSEVARVRDGEERVYLVVKKGKRIEVLPPRRRHHT